MITDTEGYKRLQVDPFDGSILPALTRSSLQNPREGSGLMLSKASLTPLVPGNDRA